MKRALQKKINIVGPANEAKREVYIDRLQSLC